MAFIKCKEVHTNHGSQLQVYHRSVTNAHQHWVSAKEVMQVMTHHCTQQQQQGIDIIITKKDDGEEMIPVNTVIHLLIRMEMDDFSLSPVINHLIQLVRGC